MANHMTQWKPEARYNERGYSNIQKIRRFNTYKELLKNMKAMLEESPDNEVCISRSKRGQWGEWFEKWQMQTIGYPNNRVVRRPVKISETWM